MHAHESSPPQNLGVLQYRKLRIKSQSLAKIQQFKDNNFFQMSFKSINYHKCNLIITGYNHVRPGSHLKPHLTFQNKFHFKKEWDYIRVSTVGVAHQITASNSSSGWKADSQSGPIKIRVRSDCLFTRPSKGIMRENNVELEWSVGK